MSLAPFFSILVPLYNKENYVLYCLESILCQSEQDFECIVCDDSSEDSSFELAQKLALNDKRFHFYRVSHKGVAYLRNYLLSKSRGEFIVWVDPDDFISKDLLNKAKTKLVGGNIDVLFFNYITLLQEKKEKKNNSPFLQGFVSKEMIFYALAEEWTFPSQLWNKIIRRSCYENLRFSNELLIFEDFELMPKLMLKANSFYFIKDCLYYYRRHSESLISSKTIEKELLQLELRKKRILFFINSYPNFVKTAITSWLISYYRSLCVVNSVGLNKFDNLYFKRKIKEKFRTLFEELCLIDIDIGFKNKLLRFFNCSVCEYVLIKLHPLLVRYKTFVCNLFL